MRIVTVLLARTGSKRIPKKPLVKLDGIPLIEYTLYSMSQLDYPGYIFTDSNEVREIINKYKLNARDKILENRKGIHFTSQELTFYNKEMKADIIVLFQLTSPFRDIELVKKWIEEFPNYCVNCAFTVKEIKLNLYMNNGTRIWPINRNYDNSENTLYKETGSIYIFHASQINKRHITDGKRKLLIDPYDFDIDTYEDLERAEMFLQREKIKVEYNIIEERK